MKKYLMTIMILTVFCSCTKEENKELYRITFEDGFKKQKVSLFINSSPIFQNQILDSSPIDGVTSFQFYILKSGIKYEGFLSNEKIDIDSSIIKDELLIKVYINDVKSEYSIDIKEGLYIGFNLKEGRLKLNQSKTQKLYN